MLMIRIQAFMAMRFFDKLCFLSRVWIRAKGVLFYRHVFASFGRGSSLEKPALLTNPHWMHIGNRVIIRQGARLEATACDSSYQPEFRIGDNVNIENFVQISSVGKLVIGSNVTVGSRTTILCGSHPFRDARSPVKVGDRVSGKNAFVEIGEGAFIGAGVAILKNVRIGKRAVIGANSVVKTSVPDYCVAEGNPARIVLRYNEEQDAWIRVNPELQLSSSL